MQRPLLVLTVAMLAVPGLAGCIGNATPDGNTTPTDVDDTPDLPTQGVLHAAGGPNATARLLPNATEVAPGVPVPVGIARSTGAQAFEPTIGALEDGTLFMTNRDHKAPFSPLLFRSTDDGLTWTDVTPKVGPTNVSYPPDTNDVYVHVDRDTGRVFEMDLIALTCSTLSISDDAGASWTQSPVPCGQPVGVHDHQTIFTGPPRMSETVGYDNVVYYCINRIADSACARSLNGGLTFGPLRPLVYSGVDPDRTASNPPFGGFCGGLHAHGTTGPDGRVYLPRSYCGPPTVAISEDDGLTWERVTISEDVHANSHEVAFAVDEAGNVYAFWIGEDRKPYLAVSTDHGFSWNEPMMVAPPGVATTDFPTVAAGAEGRVAVAYYGTSADKEYGAMEGEDTWNAYITVVVDATSSNATLATVPTNDPADPVARGECGGSRCYGTNGGGPGDFIDITIGPDGRPWAAFVDSCTGDCATGDTMENTAAIGFVGTLRQGPSLAGDLGPLGPLAGLGNATESGS